MEGLGEVNCLPVESNLGMQITVNRENLMPTLGHLKLLAVWRAGTISRASNKLASSVGLLSGLMGYSVLDSIVNGVDVFTVNGNISTVPTGDILGSLAVGFAAAMVLSRSLFLKKVFDGSVSDMAKAISKIDMKKTSLSIDSSIPSAADNPEEIKKDYKDLSKLEKALSKIIMKRGMEKQRAEVGLGKAFKK